MSAGRQRRWVLLVASLVVLLAAVSVPAGAVRGRAAQSFVVPVQRANVPVLGDRLQLRVHGLPSGWSLARRIKARGGANFVMRDDPCVPELFVGGLVGAYKLRRASLTGAALDRKLKQWLRWPGQPVQALSVRIRHDRVRFRPSARMLSTRLRSRHATVEVLSNNAPRYPLILDYLVVSLDRRPASRFYRVVFVLAQVDSASRQKGCAASVRESAKDFISDLVADVVVEPR